MAKEEIGTRPFPKGPPEPEGDAWHEQLSHILHPAAVARQEPTVVRGPGRGRR